MNECTAGIYNVLFPKIEHEKSQPRDRCVRGTGFVMVLIFVARLAHDGIEREMLSQKSGSVLRFFGFRTTFEIDE